MNKLLSEQLFNDLTQIGMLVLTNPPPRYLAHFIKWLVAPHLLEEILGDLQERYARRLKEQGEASDRRRYWLEALAFIRQHLLNESQMSIPTTQI